ncbi:MAG: hypothetical protein JWM71_203 [Solirubrobacteraceae bacterium]|nr:hypothetical protein [Solirubrobacteraceae bacterium]
MSAPAPEPRWVGVGRCESSGAADAATECIRAALAGRAAALVVMFASESLDLPTLVRRAGAEAGDAQLIGCSSSGEIATDGPGDAGVVAIAFGGEGFRVSTTAVSGIAQDARLAGAEAAACLGDVADAPHRVLLLLTDGLAGDQQEIVRGAYSIAGAGVPLVGGCAGDDLRMAATFQFCGGEVMQDTIVAAAIGSDAPLGIGVRHGWGAVGEGMLVTSSGQNRVLTLDDQPALDVYCDILDVPAEARGDAEAFTRFALTHPLGMSRRASEEQVRFIAGADFEERSLLTIAEVPQGGLVWLMEGDHDSVLAATDAACLDALAGLEGGEPRGLVVFDCIARRGVLGDEGIKREVQCVAHHAAGAPVAGFYTYGEIARTQGVSGFHNQTLVVLAIG